jgi:hypothetical protein
MATEIHKLLQKRTDVSGTAYQITDEQGRIVVLSQSQAADLLQGLRANVEDETERDLYSAAQMLLDSLTTLRSMEPSSPLEGRAEEWKLALDTGWGGHAALTDSLNSCEEELAGHSMRREDARAYCGMDEEEEEGDEDA